MDWDDLANIFNSELKDEDTEMTSSAYRKPYQNAKGFYEDVFSKMIDGQYSDKIMEQMRELERSKIQFRDERNAWQKQNYIDARVLQKLDYLEEQLLEQGKINFNTHESPVITGDNDLLVVLSDLHIGQTFSSVWGNYNSDIARDRLNQYLQEIIETQKIYNCEKCYISLQGDIISGNIHKALAITNRENVIEQIKLAIELISSFCYELTKHFSHVYFQDVVGNHSRIDKKDDALHDERLDDLIAWDIKRTLSHIDNFHVLQRKLDNSIADFSIRGKTYISVHGDFDSFNKQGVANLSLMLGFVPYACIFGHMHTNAYDCGNGVKMIRGGNLAGSGDDYTVKKRLNGQPSQIMCVCNAKGIKAVIPVELN